MTEKINGGLVNMNDWFEKICELLEETSNVTVKCGGDHFIVCCREYLNYNEHLLNEAIKEFKVRITCFEVSFHQEDIAEIVDHAENYKVMYRFGFEKIKG